MLKADDIILMFKRREFGITHTLTIDTGKLMLTYLYLEKFEGILPDLKKEPTQNFSNFSPEFNKRDLIQGFARGCVICFPVLAKNMKQAADKEEILMYFQMNGFRGVPYNALDMSLVSIVGRVAAGALLKIKGDKITQESMQHSFNILETCKYIELFSKIFPSPISYGREKSRGA